ncbi:ABC transporter ATP-binding protein [Thomasclavelia cocleata]|uniref:ABC transporter ATP-binding protein n=1 Tax=Thomasclavelia cocleata TaxID=69824 RepID=UPI00272DFF74|nr:ABC transporter ATP-binding protein [Thomasclavelia cocleata]
MKYILKKNAKILILVGISIIIVNILSASHPLVMKGILDIDITAKDALMRLFLTYFIIHIILVLAKNARNSIINKVMSKILKDLREKLFCHILKWDMSTYQKYNSSEIYTRLTADIDNVSSLFLGTMQVVLNDVVYIITMVIFMFFADIKLAIIGSVAILLNAMVSYIFTHQVANCNKIILDKRDKENKQFSEMYNKNKLTFLYGLQKKNKDKIWQTLDEELVYRKKFIFDESFIYPLAITIQAIAIYLILIYVFHINNTISLGSIYLVINYIQNCRTPLNEIFTELEEIQSSSMSLKRINKLLKEQGKEDIEKGEIVENLKGDIEFENVCMQYGENKVLHNISFIIKEGNKVTIAGKTGVGKTTLANILMRLYPIQSGKILIGGRDIKKIRIQDIRKNISYISQTPYILNDTLKNNIILGDKTITDEQIRIVANEIGFEKVLDKFPKRLEEKIEKNKLSYGQLQMIAFLRAILHRANIYIFDEPTSNIDLKTEDRIQKLIDRITQESTVIIIAHRKSTIENSDKIIYLKDGQIDIIVNKEKV